MIYTDTYQNVFQNMNDKPENIKGLHPSHPHLIAYGKEKKSISHFYISLEKHIIYVSKYLRNLHCKCVVCI